MGHMDTTQLSRTEASERAPGWRYLLGALQLALEFRTFDDAVAFLATVAKLAGERDHHPDVDLRYNRLFLTCTSHDADGVTERDVDLANAISDAAEAAGATSTPGSLTAVEWAIDTMDSARIIDFWAAVLGYEVAGDEVSDPAGRNPTIWFQQLDEPRPVRNRIHVDVTVPHDEAEARIAAALAAGGRMVSDERAPSWWILADADGNEACICTWQSRDQAEPR